MNPEYKWKNTQENENATDCRMDNSNTCRRHPSRCDIWCETCILFGCISTTDRFVLPLPNNSYASLSYERGDDGGAGRGGGSAIGAQHNYHFIYNLDSSRSITCDANFITMFCISLWLSFATLCGSTRTFATNNKRVKRSADLLQPGDWWKLTIFQEHTIIIDLFCQVAIVSSSSS